MKPKLIAMTFLTLSVIFIIFWFQVYQSTKRFNKEINLIEKKILLSKESNKILLSEYTAHTNPSYIKYLSSIYLENEDQNYEKISIFSNKNFINKIDEIKLIVPTSINDNMETKLEKK